VSARYAVNLRAPFASDWRKSLHADLAAALSSAWRKHSRDWSVGSITKEQKVVIDNDALAQAFARMDDLLRELPRRPAREAAEQVIREIDAGEKQG
jgi:predicted trehalose synthase